LANDLQDLQQRLGDIKVGRRVNKEMVFAKDIRAEGAMTVLLKEALNPNLVQTLEHNPALVHGGPYGNIAHGCSSVVATKAALTLADYVVTEGGFGADLGAEKFFDIKCRQAGLTPACAVVVGTVRALKLHGGAKEKELEQEDLGALRKGLPNLLRHLENVKKFGVPAVVAINQFTSDTKRELELVEQACADHGVKLALANHWAKGGAGALGLAETVREVIEKEPADFRVLYPDTIPLAEKLRIIAREIYRAEDVEIPPAVHARFAELENNGYGHFPICMAKTQYSFSTDPAKKGAPSGFTLPVREVRLAMGAGFVVVIAGDMRTMPGLPRVPAAESIGVDAKGNIVGLF
jgi:formate--tetrahydrofolate ligase